MTASDSQARLEVFPEDWERGLAVVAHPDDMEYGAAAAVARWTGQGKSIAYILVSDGEAGMADVPPAEAGPIRRDEQLASCAIVGVSEVEFLGWPDGAIVEGLALRADLAAAIRRHEPEVVLSINHRDGWGPGSWNHADHRAVGRALLDAVRDAANPWIFPDRGAAWSGVRFTAFNASPYATHAVDTTDSFEIGVRSLEAHRRYLDSIGGDMATPESFLRRQAAAAGKHAGVELAATFEMVG
ncbi:MAG TPA: PIG-L deacetylase family protein [Acidimicrobiales bacterium]|nr:PIG-L deacetylase family protein [Acidimicrobiales bacterium]